MLVVFAVLARCGTQTPAEEPAPHAVAPSFETHAERYDTITPITFEPFAPGLEPDSLTAHWDLDGDGNFDVEGAVAPVTHHYLRVGDYNVTFELSDQTGATIHSEAATLTIGHPDRWPRTVPTYFVGGFTEDEFDAVLAGPGTTRAVMIAGFDLFESIAEQPDGTWEAPIRQDRIDAIHQAGLLAYVDVARGWAPQAFWSDWKALSDWLVQLAEAGIDGIDFDEFEEGLEAQALNALQADLRAVNPHLRLIVTQIYASQLTALLSDGATPDYIALAWYIAGQGGFDQCKTLAASHGVRCAYWTDPASYAQIGQTYQETSAVLLWNLCWNPSTCGSAYAANTWVPWADVRPLLDGLDAFEQP